MSELKVKYITGTIGEGEENSPITLSGDTATLGSGVALGSGVTFPAGGTGNPISIAILWDQKSGQTSGGSKSANVWQDRTLNMETDPDNIVSLTNGTTGEGGAANQFILGAGTFHVAWRVPGFFILRHQSALTLADNTMVQQGSSAYADTASGYENYEVNMTFGETIVTPASSTTYKIRHYSNSGHGDGLGYPSPHSSIDSIFTTVRITKLK